MTFEDYLVSKKIDSAAFQKGEPIQWEEWKNLFEHVHPNSFTVQKLYLINTVRRRFKLSPQEATVPKTDATPAARPVMRPKMK